jgi:hypothetical protein
MSGDRSDTQTEKDKARELYKKYEYIARDVLSSRMIPDEIDIICEYAYADIVRDTLARMITDINGRCSSNNAVVWIDLPGSRRSLVAYHGKTCIIGCRFMSADDVTMILTRADRLKQQGLLSVHADLIDDIWNAIDKYTIEGARIIQVRDIFR